MAYQKSGTVLLKGFLVLKYNNLTKITYQVVDGARHAIIVRYLAVTARLRGSLTMMA